MKLLIKLASMALVAISFGTASVSANEANNQSHKITIEQPWTPHTGKRKMSAAAYFTMHNWSDENDTLVDVKSDIAEMTMLHRSYEKDGVMRMDHVDGLEVPAGGTAALAPGGYHVMFMQLHAPLKRGEHFPLTLVFEKAGEVTVQVEITGVGGLEK